jgi:malonyl CoA-acyl carrier protein transacylase
MCVAPVGPLIGALTRQISGSVHWIGNLKALADTAKVVIKVGPSGPLSRFLKETGRDVSAMLDVRGAKRLFGGGQA